MRCIGAGRRRRLVCPAAARGVPHSFLSRGGSPESFGLRRGGDGRRFLPSPTSECPIMLRCNGFGYPSRQNLVVRDESAGSPGNHIPTTLAYFVTVTGIREGGSLRQPKRSRSTRLPVATAPSLHRGSTDPRPRSAETRRTRTHADRDRVPESSRLEWFFAHRVASDCCPASADDSVRSSKGTLPSPTAMPAESTRWSAGAAPQTHVRGGITVSLRALPTRHAHGRRCCGSRPGTSLRVS
jgi:hypothetical protein